MSWPKEAYAGVIFPNQSQFFGAGTGGNNHQSVFEFEGKYYFTYHAPTLNKRINGNTTQGYRSPHIQELTFNADGTIKQVVGTYAGVDQVRDFDPYRVFEAETLGWSKGIATHEGRRRLRGVRRRGAEPGGAATSTTATGPRCRRWTSATTARQSRDGEGASPCRPAAQIQVRLDAATVPWSGTIASTPPSGEWAEVTAELEGVDRHARRLLHLHRPARGDLFEIDTLASSRRRRGSVARRLGRRPAPGASQARRS